MKNNCTLIFYQRHIMEPILFLGTRMLYGTLYNKTITNDIWITLIVKIWLE